MKLRALPHISLAPFRQVVLFPLSGDPDMYLSFTKTFPNGHNFDYKQALPMQLSLSSKHSYLSLD